MHSTIYQISRKTVVEDDHMDLYDIHENDYGRYGIDWVGDERDDEDGFDGLESALPKEMFAVNRENRTITVKPEGVKVVLRQMIDAIQKAANALNEDNILNWQDTYNVREALNNYLDGSALFYFDDELMSLNQFIKDVASSDCTTLYVGAMLDYHI